MGGLEKYFNDPEFIKWIKKPDAKSDAWWQSWKKNNPDKVDEINEAIALLKSMRFNEYPVSEEDKKNDWQKIKAGTQSSPRHKGRSFSITFYRAAAVVLLLIGTAFSIYLLNSNSPSEEQLPVSYIHKETLPGQKLSIQLSDGTSIKLNADSKLVYPSEFSAEARVVELSGEGYFQVAKNPDRPFIVKSGNVIIKVLGTRFNVNGYDESKIEVGLVEGSVEVSAGVGGREERKLIVPGEKAFWESDHLAVEKLDTIRDIGWKDNILSFHKNNIGEIKNILERWYGVAVFVEDAHKLPGSFNGEFQHENLSNVLESIGFAMDFDFSIDDKKVYIKPV